MSAHDYQADELMTTCPSRNFLVTQAVMNMAWNEWRESWRAQLYFASCQGEFVPKWVETNIRHEYRLLREVYHA